MAWSDILEDHSAAEERMDWRVRNGRGRGHLGKQCLGQVRSRCQLMRPELDNGSGDGEGEARLGLSFRSEISRTS